MKKANLLEKEGRVADSFAIRNEVVNQSLTSLFKNKVEEFKLEKYPQEIDYYLAKNEQKASLMQEEIGKINNLSQKTSENYQRKNNLEKRKVKINKEQERKRLGKYLIYVTNNERL
jgi:hypothetical protein